MAHRGSVRKSANSVKPRKRFRVITGLLICFMTACAASGVSGTARGEAPRFNSYRGSYELRGGVIAVKSYYQKRMFFRTEYTYESLDFEIPDGLEVGRRYEFEKHAKKVFYTSGGQAGQIETATAKGSMTIVSRSADRIRFELDLTFSGFTTKGHIMEIPSSLTRTGQLTADKGAKIY